MKLLSPLLGYTIQNLCHPIEYVTKQAFANFPLSHNLKIIMNQAYGAHPQQQLDIYWQFKNSTQNTTPQKPIPIVVYVHGGGWVAGDKSLFHKVCQIIAAQGYLVFNINYRLAPKYLYTQQIQDINIALKWVIQNCARYNGNPNVLFLAGDSSGANLITTYAASLNCNYLRKAFHITNHISKEQLLGLVLIYGIFDLEQGIFSYEPIARHFKEMFLGHSNYNELVEYASPIRHLTKQFAPTFVTAGEIDPLFSQTILLTQKLRKLKVKYATALFPKEQYPKAHSWLFHLQRQAYSQLALSEAITFIDVYNHPVQQQQSTMSATES